MQAEDVVATALACIVESASKTECGSPATKFQQANDCDILFVHFGMFLDWIYYMHGMNIWKAIHMYSSEDLIESIVSLLASGSTYYLSKF